MRCRFGRLPGAGLSVPSFSSVFSAVFFVIALCRVDFLNGLAAHRRYLFGGPQRLQRRDGSHHNVDRIVRAETFRENVVDAGKLEHRAHRAARDHAGARRSRLEEHGCGADFVANLVRNRALHHRYVHEALARLLDGLANRFGDFTGFTDRVADLAFTIADDDERAEAKALTAFDDLGNAVHANHRLFEPAAVAFATTPILHQKFSPASRAASASARTRP